MRASRGRQLLMEAKYKLEEVTERRFGDAVARRDHAAAVRFAKLYRPLGRQVRYPPWSALVGSLLLVLGVRVRWRAAQALAGVSDSGHREPRPHLCGMAPGSSAMLCLGGTRSPLLCCASRSRPGRGPAAVFRVPPERGGSTGEGRPAGLAATGRGV
jgi:hypothetical protein